jgi:hypothetical protein
MTTSELMVSPETPLVVGRRADFASFRGTILESS